MPQPRGLLSWRRKGEHERLRQRRPPEERATRRPAIKAVENERHGAVELLPRVLEHVQTRPPGAAVRFVCAAVGSGVEGTREAPLGRGRRVAKVHNSG